MEQLITKFFNKPESAHFVAFLFHSPNFIDSFSFKILGPFTQNFIWLCLSPSQNLEKTNPIPRKCSDGRTGRFYL